MLLQVSSVCIHTQTTELTSEALTSSIALLFQASSWLFLRCSSCWMLFAASSTRLQAHTNKHTLFASSVILLVNGDLAILSLQSKLT